jgi:hypothetical protein
MAVKSVPVRTATPELYEILKDWRRPAGSDRWWPRSREGRWRGSSRATRAALEPGARSAGSDPTRTRRSPQPFVTSRISSNEHDAPANLVHELRQRRCSRVAAPAARGERGCHRGKGDSPRFPLPNSVGKRGLSRLSLCPRPRAAAARRLHHGLLASRKYGSTSPRRRRYVGFLQWGGGTEAHAMELTAKKRVKATTKAKRITSLAVSPMHRPAITYGGLCEVGTTGRRPQSSHRRLMVESRPASRLYTRADAPTSKDRCLTSGSFIAENTMTLAAGFTCMIWRHASNPSTLGRLRSRGRLGKPYLQTTCSGTTIEDARESTASLLVTQKHPARRPHRWRRAGCARCGPSVLRGMSCGTRRARKDVRCCAAAQGDSECRAPIGIVVGIDGATMRVDDRPRDRESDPDAVRFRRDEWCEQRAVDLRRQTGSAVAQRDRDIGGPDLGADGDATTSTVSPSWGRSTAIRAYGPGSGCIANRVGPSMAAHDGAAPTRIQRSGTPAMLASGDAPRRDMDPTQSANRRAKACWAAASEA